MACTSSTLVLHFHMQRMFMLSEWSHQTHSGHPKQHQCCHGRRWKKCQTGRIKSWKGYFVLRWPYGTFSINKLCLSILIIKNNLICTCMWLFLGGHDEKWTEWYPDRWKKGQDFVYHCTFWGLGTMLQVSYMNEKLGKSAF